MMRTTFTILALIAVAQTMAIIISQSLMLGLQAHIELRQVEQNRLSREDFNELLATSRYAKVVKVIYCTARWYEYPLYALYRWYQRQSWRHADDDN